MAKNFLLRKLQSKICPESRVFSYLVDSRTQDDRLRTDLCCTRIKLLYLTCRTDWRWVLPISIDSKVAPLLDLSVKFRVSEGNEGLEEPNCDFC
jgi:hypothetical protein